MTRAATEATEPDLIQILTPDGQRQSHGTYDAYLGDVDDDMLRGFYRDMALTRRFDQEATALQRQGQLCLWVPLRGQEAAQIGSGRATRRSDYIFPTYREHGVALTRDVSFSEMLRLFRGISGGGWDPRENNFHMYTMVLAAQMPHAAGYAMALNMEQRGWDEARRAKEGNAVVAYFGDGSSTEGETHESMVFASSFNAPVVYFCQNNQWAISVPFEVQSKVPLVNRAAGYGMPGVRVDGNDVLAVLAVTRWALEHARSGKGPVLIEAVTYRLGAHTTADDPTKYRMSEEEAQWAPKDPLIRLETYLRENNLVDDAYFEQLAADADAMAAKVREDAMAFPVPPLAKSFEQVYAEAHPLIQEELAWHLEYEAGFADAAEGEH
ncbi:MULTISPECIES: pyruvate dehydrogenase (acetyl-transferring) E1 component subunit alpha [Actinomycetes]|uniref:pyruvate dehydrogenase (acetyl-transferring) E1 component subunit alpha n=1 Tax=Actinomycetes TaxID=1760 RepID=UPI000CFDD9B7|nr:MULTISPECIES: pyruvate dehydrogenase (acetyl-transferring) E1 component subunit alpha [unclassified Arthrobacter]MCS3493047.1 pyruvate dehydrogenase E1 component alpha subunit [Arthrobacter sp. JUb119]PQZ90509.1 pyruvate dehydrogenase (acetyl-transferring) E1 component subunit alpha [Arthrobacter sp. MYb222]PRB75912.1 pyruvate dehydrogenase (acetyl-transferring) E1 component subunit alpha [Arthrobacter sp. MYb214]TDU26112.1 pyruvate dehydrogenase E1 component alpha subunit [Arthrobacter sp. 